MLEECQSWAVEEEEVEEVEEEEVEEEGALTRT